MNEQTNRTALSDEDLDYLAGIMRNWANGYQSSEEASCVLREVVLAERGSAAPDSDLREFLGKLVRAEWVKWAREQPSPKPSWLQSWDELTEPEREVDRRIGEAIWRFSYVRDAQQPVADSPAPPVRSKNGRVEFAQPGAVVEPPEPVAWGYEARAIDTAWMPALSRNEPAQGPYLRNVVPLYAAPVVPSSLPPEPDQSKQQGIGSERSGSAVQRAADEDRADETWLGFEFEVWQDDMMQASASAENYEEALKEARHYALMYGQDGPVKVCQVVRRWIDLDSPPAASGNVAEARSDSKEQPEGL